MYIIISIIQLKLCPFLLFQLRTLNVSYIHLLHI